MPRSRVLSFMSQWGGGPRSPTSDNSPSEKNASNEPARKPSDIDTSAPQRVAQNLDADAPKSPGSPSMQSRARGDSKPARPLSMLQTYNPPQVEVAPDTPPELQPIFSFLNSHSNKLYQEGYFLKLHDLDSRGRPSPDRVWNECFAQLVGTVLSLWDAAALDVAGEDGEVVPTFVNLSDASIKMIESLPMNGAQGGSLQNVLSISTAANNRYLLHFNSLNSLTQWTAGIRLAMFEHSTLQEAYTGSLIAGKGRYLNNIKQIMFRLQFPHEDWIRVRFGAGTPWKRCWCVISPPDEKEYAKAQKTMKKSSAYEKVKLPKGSIKFYDTRKVTKKTQPVATISDAFAAYAIYPQSKPLIEQSTLVKLEGLVTIHTSPETTTEGFVFVMPEVHAAVTGFEMMLRWLFPVYDTFNLYGRPIKLIADTLDQRGLMFALPKDRRYGLLDILDVSGLIHTQGSQNWSERQWRRELKKLTAERMSTHVEGEPRQVSHRRSTMSRTSLPGSGAGVRFGDGDSVHSTPGSRSGSRSGSPAGGENRIHPAMRTDSAPPGVNNWNSHKRSVSEAQGYRRYATETPSRLSEEASRPEDGELPPPPPKHGGALGGSTGPGRLERIQSEAEVPTVNSAYNDLQAPAPSPYLSPPAPVGAPPAFTHQPNSQPIKKPFASPELRRANSAVDAATLYQMQDATRPNRNPDRSTSDDGVWNGEVQQRQQNTVASQSYANRNLGVPADRSQGAANRQRDLRQRLSTIQGSPYVGSDAEYFQSPQQMSMPQMDGVIEQRPPSNNEPQPDRPAPPVPIHSSHSIARKPVPRPLPQLPQVTPNPDGRPPLQRSISDPTSSPKSPTTESWEGGIIDEEALEQVLNAPDRHNTMQSTTTESTEPDYASTISASTRDKRSIEKPRTGKLKTVGDPDFSGERPGRLDTWQADQVANAAAIPNVNFGPTYAYKPNSRPGTSGTMTPGDMAEKRRSRSADRLRESSRERLGGTGTFGQSPRPSPNENHRHSYFGGRNNTPSPGHMTPEVLGDRNGVMWQPSPSPAPGVMHRSKTSVTPEEWVQQRAAMAQQPQYAPPRKATPDRYGHNRSKTTGPRKLTKSPPLSRTRSGDWTQQAGRQTPPARPSSRGAGVNLDSASQSLSAREQMQVSRATGTPLVNLASTPNKQQQQMEQPGMIGVVAQRERDKAASKEGRNSMFVQQAIFDRQQQQLRTEADAQAQREYQLQMQAQSAQQQQQQMGWNQMMYPQNQQAPMQYPAHLQRPDMQKRHSWGYGGGRQSPSYQTGYQQYSPGAYGGTYSPGQQQQQVPQQQYGASYFAQQQQGGQGQQWGRR